MKKKIKFLIYIYKVSTYFKWVQVTNYYIKTNNNIILYEISWIYRK